MVLMYPSYDHRRVHLITLIRWMQAVVDFRGRFLDVNIGWPGKVHDARVLVNSSFYRKAISGTLIPDWSKRIGRTSVPLVVLGDQPIHYCLG